MEVARVHDVGRRDAVELAPGELLDADAEVGAAESTSTYASLSSTEGEWFWKVVDEAVARPGWPALERAPDAAAELEAPAEPARRPGVECRASRSAPGRWRGSPPASHDREAVEIAVDRESSPAPGHVDRRRARRQREERAAAPERHFALNRGKAPLYTPRMQPRALQKDLDRQIVATHRRFVKAMDGRLGDLSADTKERYFAVLSALVAKLEESGEADA